jgi:N-acetylmuramate 1-kinase
VTDADRFLTASGWGGAARVPLAGDASSRFYARLLRGSETAILMSLPDGFDDVARRFLRVTDWLRARGYSAPAIIAQDAALRWLLIEDLGDNLIARQLASAPGRAGELYALAVDFLVDLNRHTPREFAASLNGAALADLVDVIPRWYLAGTGRQGGAGADRIGPEIASLYDALGGEETVLSLRDFHAENLVWLPDRIGVARLGILDHQDALAAHPTYDLVSLLQDARRDVPEHLETEMIQRFVRDTAQDEDRFRAIYALLGAQRALRIIGVFARLCLVDGKAQYLQLIPREFGYLARNLRHPALRSLKGVIDAALPRPGEAGLERLRIQCGIYRTA